MTDQRRPSRATHERRLNRRAATPAEMSVSPTRFARLPAWPARMALAALVLLMALGVTIASTPAHGPDLVAPGKSDTALYRAIARDTAAGGATPAAYYRAVAAEQRARGYPLRPFVTVREPALALLAAWLGSGPLGWLYRALALVATGALVWRIQGGLARAERIGAALCATISVLILAQPVMAVWHEAWAALLLVLALVGAGGRRWWLACVAGLAMLLVRELAAPAIVALAFAALAERRRAEATGWSLVLVAFALTMLAHAHAVAAVTLPGDAASPGWTSLGGWRFILSLTANSSAFSLLPLWLTALALPLALFGWASRGDPFADRVTLALAALIAPFMGIGRPDNFYWGLLIAPLLPIGLAFAPRGLVDLARSARQSRAGTAWDAAWTADASS